MAKKLHRLVFPTVFLPAAFACWSSARGNLSQLSRSHDLFALSLVVATALAALFILASIATIRRSNDDRSKQGSRTWPGILALAILAIGVSAAVIGQETPTSFVSWEQLRGAPLYWLKNGHFYGPCAGQPCRTYWLMSVRPLALVIDSAVMIAAIYSLRRQTTR